MQFYLLKEVQEVYSLFNYELMRLFKEHSEFVIHRNPTNGRQAVETIRLMKEQYDLICKDRHLESQATFEESCDPKDNSISFDDFKKALVRLAALEHTSTANTAQPRQSYKQYLQHKLLQSEPSLKTFLAKFTRKEQISPTKNSVENERESVDSTVLRNFPEQLEVSNDQFDDYRLDSPERV